MLSHSLSRSNHLDSGNDQIIDFQIVTSVCLSCTTGQSDWSEIDNAFSSDDDEELFSYFETNSANNYKAQSASIVSNEALSERPACASFDIRKGQHQHSAEQPGIGRARKLLPKKVSSFSPFISDAGGPVAFSG